MNINAIEHDESTYIVTDHNHNISKIKTDNTDPSEILNLENEIESLKYRLEDTKEMVKLTKQNTVGAEVINAITYLSIIFFALSLPSTGEIVYMSSLTYLILKMVNVATQGTRLGRHALKKSLIEKIEQMEKELPELEKTYEKKKQESKYCQIERTESYKPSICQTEYLHMVDSIPKVKVLSRKRKK